MDGRVATENEIDRLARIWHDAWRGALVRDGDPESGCRFLDSLRSLGMTGWGGARSE